MKGRILYFLKKIALDKFSTAKEKEELLAMLGVDDVVAQKKAFSIMDTIIKNYNFFQVQTIDSFINAILSGCAFRLGLSANFRIKTEYKDYLAYALDKLIDHAAIDQKTRRAFANFLHQYLILENKTGWSPKKEILAAINDLFSSVNKYGGDFLPCPGDVSDLLAQKKNTLASMRQLKRDLPSETHATFEKKLSDFLGEHKDNFNFSALSEYFMRTDFPVRKNGVVSSNVKKIWEQIRKELRVIAELESRLTFNAYIEIFNKVFLYFKALSAKDDILFLEELNRETRILLDEKGMSVPELYYRLAMRLNHFLIDEFQDTSRLQWKNLEIMVDEALSVGGSLFYVGDKKQAIYRFRGGDVTLFDTVKEGYKNSNLCPQFLRHNYRSQKEIVLFINEVFSTKNLENLFKLGAQETKEKEVFSAAEEEAVLRVFKEVRQSPVAGKEGGFVNVEFLDSKKKEERNALAKDKLFCLLDDLKARGWGYRDIALLVRENDDVELLSAWLIEKGLPVESEKTLNIRNNPLIKELVSFLKFLNSPIDNIAFVSFILGDIFSTASGLSKDELGDFIFELRETARIKKDVYFYREFRYRFPEAWESLIEEFFKNVGFIPLYELAISIYSAFKCLERFSDHQGFLMRLLELIKEQEEDRQSLPLFLEFFDKAGGEDLYVRTGKTNAVNILTIHKAKGLGFPVVILPFLEMNAEVKPVLVKASDGVLSLQRISEKYRKYSFGLQDAYRQEYLKSFIDELDNVYVALTRAREELHVFLPQKTRGGLNWARLLIGEHDFQRGKGERAVLTEKVPSDALLQELPFSRYGDWIPFLKDEFIDRGLIRRRREISRGEVLHYIFSSLNDGTSAGLEPALKAAFKNARMKFPFVEDFSEHEALVRKIVDDKKMELFFLIGEGQVFTEKEVVDEFGCTKRMDRLIVKKDSVWVIDYKSSKSERDEDRQQVQAYKALISKIYPQKTCKGFLVYFDSCTWEEVI